MPRWDFSCNNCGWQDELTFSSYKATQATVYCPKCLAITKRLPAKGVFIVSGYSAKNGYSTKD